MIPHPGTAHTVRRLQDEALLARVRRERLADLAATPVRASTAGRAPCWPAGRGIARAAARVAAAVARRAAHA
jgi:hypothetical protein